MWTMLLSKPFLKLPTKKELPDYYELIREPIDLRKIKERIKKDRYGCLEDMTRDFDLLISNTKTYNIEGSLIYEDSTVLHAVYQQACDIIEKHNKLPNELEEDDLDNNDNEHANVEDDTMRDQSNKETEDDGLIQNDQETDQKISEDINDVQNYKAEE